MDAFSQAPGPEGGLETPERDAASGAGEAPLSPAGVQRGLRLWLAILIVAGGACALMKHAEGALLVAFAGLFVLAQATDAATAFAGYRDWVHTVLPRRRIDGMLVRTLVRGVLPLTGAGIYLGLAMFAAQSGDSPAQKLAVLWCRAAAVISLLLVLRPVADTITRLLFRGGIAGRTRRLTARVFVLAILAPVPAQLLLPDILRTLGASTEPLVSPGALIAQLIGEITIAFAGIGLFVRRDARASLERLGLTRLTPAYLAVGAVGFAAAFGVNGGMEWIERHMFPGLYALDTQATKLIAADLSIAASIVLGVSAGAGEELTVRGALQPRLGIVLASVLFACGHVQYTWFGMLTIGLLGVVLGLVRQRSNTTTAILVHGIYDLIAALGARH